MRYFSFKKTQVADEKGRGIFTRNLDLKVGLRKKTYSKELNQQNLTKKKERKLRIYLQN